MLCRVALGTQIVEQRINSEVLIIVLLKPIKCYLNSLSSTIINTSELILCSTICVPSATRHNIHVYRYDNSLIIKSTKEVFSVAVPRL